MFDSSRGIPAPLQKWHSLFTARNNAIGTLNTKFCYATGISYPYGRKCFYISNRYSPYSKFVLRPLSSGYSGVKASVYGGPYVLNETYTQSVSEWEKLVQGTLDPTRSPVCLIHYKKVSQVFSGVKNYSEYMRIAIDDKQPNAAPQSIVVNGIPVGYEFMPQTDELKMVDARPISDIADKYIIDYIETYATDSTGKLPRQVVDYRPIIISSVASVYSTSSAVGSYKKILPIGMSSLLPSYPSSTYGVLGQDSETTSQPFSFDTASGSGNMGFVRNVADFKIANMVSITDTGTILQGVRAEYKNPFGAKMIIGHNIDNGTTITGNVKSRSRYYYLGTEGTITASKGIFATTIGAPYQQATVIFDSLDNIREMFEDAGITCTFDDTEAQYYPVEDLGDGIASGFDTNNTPSIDSFPDNNTDDYVVDIGSNPAALATNANIFTAAAVSNLMDWFTTPDFWDAFSKLFDNPLSAIMSLRYYPFDIVRHDPIHTTAVNTVRIVNVENNNIGGYTFEQDYNTIINGGTIDYTAYYGNWADWACTRYDIYLPYLGIVNISPSAIVNKHLAVFYNVDFLTGNAQIFVKTYDDKYNKSGYNNGQLVYTATAQIAVDIPIVYNNYNQQNIYKAVSALTAVTGVTQGAIQGASQGAATGNPYAAIAGAIVGGVGSLGNNALNYATNYPRTTYGANGSIGVGILSPQDAYLLITRRILAIPADGYGNISGNPSAYYGLIKSASGYVKATAAKCDGITATNSELDEIAALLAAGIYI